MVSSGEGKLLSSLYEVNPWRHLPREAPYVLDADVGAIKKLNSRLAGKPHEIRLEPMPEPFMGTPNAPIWILNLNPGFDEADLLHDQSVRDAQREAIELRASNFWPLQDRYSNTPTYQWWNKRLGQLVRDFGSSKVAKGVFCVELFPYHSAKFYSAARVPSQEFTYQLVSAGCQMQKLFIFVRGKRQWLENVPALAQASTVAVNTPRCAYISRGNIRDHEMVWDALAGS